MAPQASKKDKQALDREIERYREAAAAALDQLEWVINYLHQIRKDALAKALDRNRVQIIEQARHH